MEAVRGPRDVVGQVGARQRLHADRVQQKQVALLPRPIKHHGHQHAVVFTQSSWRRGGWIRNPPMCMNCLANELAKIELKICQTFLM